MSVLYDENFLVRNGKGFGVDNKLPLRIQKRILLNSLGFPQNPDLKACVVSEKQRLISLIDEYLGSFGQFIIIVSEKPMCTLTTPLFVIKSEKEVIWRNNGGITKTIPVSEIGNTISQFQSNTWLEFSPNIWTSGSIGGRLIYLDDTGQVIEIQQETIPAQLLMNKMLPVYSGNLEYFEIIPKTYNETADNLRGLAYQYVLFFYEVKYICDIMRSHEEGFKKLSRISSMPTLEFGITQAGAVVSLDVDWPNQWIKT